MHYPVGPVFEYLACCESLIRNTNLLVESTAVSGPSVDDAGDDQTTSGRAGTSTAPDGGFGVNGGKASAQPTPADVGDVETVARLASLADAWGQESAQKHQRHEDNQRIQGHKLALYAFNSLYAGVSMTLVEWRSALEELRQSYAPKTSTRIVNGVAGGGGGWTGV
ncbi:hypothetical protein BU14_0109s0050 [Porphyra umbilicalis]|uniref:Uncharacterized protein n=1 Tax=Porphyra umbilicalis TaxID=2786 RepID=A0A1X6PC47_PORUM|nr:hypothetical protein BU14_0109s0050 [Porphyra umbilicalis]|eukprot:OSX78451.1 hypothetical protein BU14_0109s0050 [Porphyra umbilicalis]